MDTMDATDGLTPWPVLALNSGSSSFKFGLYRVQATSACPVTVETLMSDSMDSIDAGNAHATIADISIDVRLAPKAYVGRSSLRSEVSRLSDLAAATRSQNRNVPWFRAYALATKLR